MLHNCYARPSETLAKHCVEKLEVLTIWSKESEKEMSYIWMEKKHEALQAQFYVYKKYAQEEFKKFLGETNSTKGEL